MDVPTLTPPDAAVLALREAAQTRVEMAERFFAYDEIRQLPVSDREWLFEILLKAQSGDPSILRDLYTLVYEEIPVPPDEFLLSRQYLGLAGRINPVKVELFAYLTHPALRKGYIAAGSGSGKSFLTSLLQAYETYQLLCLKHPQLFYMLGAGSRIATVNLSVGKEQAKDVVYAEFLGRISNSPWFRRQGYEDLSSRCRFPKQIYALSGGSSGTSYYGYHTKMGCVDEISHLLDREGRSLAEELVEALIKSLTTRFPNSYKLMQISTLRADDDYLYKNIERIKATGTRLVHRPDPYVEAIRQRMNG